MLSGSLYPHSYLDPAFIDRIKLTVRMENESLDYSRGSRKKKAKINAAGICSITSLLLKISYLAALWLTPWDGNPAWVTIPNTGHVSAGFKTVPSTYSPNIK